MSDNDFIRRGDVLREIANEGLHILDAAIAALPARGVGVKQLQWKQAGGDIKEGEGFSAWPDLIHTPVTIYRKRDGWWLNLDCKTHPTLDAAKAAAQADYEARILAALAAHVNEPPKSEHVTGNMAVEVKRHEHKLPLANWLRDQINEILARYDIPSDVYERDVRIDALCVMAIDKTEHTLPAVTQPALEHVNETAKTEHDAGNVLTDAQAREAALDALASLDMARDKVLAIIKEAQPAQAREANGGTND